MSVHLPLDLLPSLVREYVRPRKPHLVEPLSAALDVLASEGELTTATLQGVFEAASDDNQSVYELGTTVLGKLAERFEEGQHAIKEMSRSKRAHVRHNAVLCLSEDVPVQITTGVIRLALVDKAARVRRKAADWLGRLRLRSVAPDLEKALSVERDEETRRVMSAELVQLREDR